jgi:hypothetical protein
MTNIKNDDTYCVYDGESYPLGTQICIDGHVNVCTQDGLFEPTGDGCGELNGKIVPKSQPPS